MTYTYTGPQLQSVQDGATTYATYSNFTALRQPGTLTRHNGTTTTYTYDATTARLKTLKTVQGTTVLQDLGYTFDPGGNVTGITDPRHGKQSFSYDGLDRLTGATGGYGTVTYTYNQIGNMLSNSQVGAYTYNASGATNGTYLSEGLSDEAIALRREAVFRLLESMEIIDLTRPILTRVAQPLPTIPGTLDAIHLATALLWREGKQENLVMTTHDTSLAIAARASGFHVVGAP